MTDTLSIRLARETDTDACADILNEWIDARDWMPRIHTQQAVRDFYRDYVFPQRDLYVVGDPPVGFMALDPDDDCVTALYLAQTGRGLGKRFLEFAKTGRRVLRLWTFQANTRARAFYQREGFREERRTDGDNEEGLPDILLRWDAA
ncbi:GNAT family N-acetyltransferase [Jannaschia sp. CCS1]|uniref:GNAT family N-acetyltransferase n=1 Tax=Jannaschia sp. (strain CCS1) TaxID=290400 RepID=UPI000053C287|nr:GNAT family N-acetyltransferase [Jannaschia sp. CCS1]ABD55619.1 GCN5-related N-acetyltransferase [Jannaschia sp. CCS1]